MLRTADIQDVDFGWVNLRGIYARLCFPGTSIGKESACNDEEPSSVPGLGRSAGEGIGYPLQYSGLENSMDYVVHVVAKSRTRLSDFHFHFQMQDWLTLIGCC